MTNTPCLNPSVEQTVNHHSNVKPLHSLVLKPPPIHILRKWWGLLQIPARPHVTSKNKLPPRFPNEPKSNIGQETRNTINYKQNPYISALPSKIFAEHKSNDNDRCGDKVTDSESEELNKNLLCNNTQETLECFTSQLTSEPNNGNVYLLSENDSRSSVTSQPIQRAPI